VDLVVFALALKRSPVSLASLALITVALSLDLATHLWCDEPRPVRIGNIAVASFTLGLRVELAHFEASSKDETPIEGISLAQLALIADIILAHAPVVMFLVWISTSCARAALP
jgi:hypothetical protein